MTTPDFIKVPAVGTSGGLLSHLLAKIEPKDLTLAELASIGSMIVSGVTIIYVLTKLYFLVKNKGKGG